MLQPSGFLHYNMVEVHVSSLFSAELCNFLILNLLGTKMKSYIGIHDLEMGTNISLGTMGTPFDAYILPKITKLYLLNPILINHFQSKINLNKKNFFSFFPFNFVKIRNVNFYPSLLISINCFTCYKK